ncbi:MAG: NAD(P)-dependent oxidoreductase [Oscillospiraceae bacterium]|nr:NAD(P)-dependent oxidoreductase [Oscillospiraceae bacterium]
MDTLVGYTGFVGSNLYKQHRFEGGFNSKNIADAFNLNPGLCVYAGVHAEKFAADKFPEQDFSHIIEALENIRKINPKRLVLISTVDVIPSPQAEDVFEDTQYQTDGLTPYGQNRLFLENELRKLYPNMLIIRLPALFGDGLKKNFIFDLINIIPVMLRYTKFAELNAKAPQLSNYYKKDDTGFFRIALSITANEQAMLKSLYRELGFSALNFTDSRSKFSFYNIKYLWEHIELLLRNNVALVHMASEPISAGEIYHTIHGKVFTNEIMSQPFDYTFFKTRYSEILGGQNGYIFRKQDSLTEIKNFIDLKKG